MCLLVRRIKLVVQGSNRLRIELSCAPQCIEIVTKLNGGGTVFLPVNSIDSGLMPSSLKAIIFDEQGHDIHTLDLPHSFVPFKEIVFHVDKPFEVKPVPFQGWFDQFSRIYLFGFPIRKRGQVQPDAIQSSPNNLREREDESSLPYSHSMDVIEDTLDSSRSLSFNTEASSSFNSSAPASENAPIDQNARSFNWRPDGLIKKIMGTRMR